MIITHPRHHLLWWIQCSPTQEVCIFIRFFIALECCIHFLKHLDGCHYIVFPFTTERQKGWLKMKQKRKYVRWIMRPESANLNRRKMTRGKKACLMYLSSWVPASLFCSRKNVKELYTHGLWTHNTSQHGGRERDEQRRWGGRNKAKEKTILSRGWDGTEKRVERYEKAGLNWDERL